MRSMEKYLITYHPQIVIAATETQRNFKRKVKHDKYGLFANPYNYWASSSRTKPDTANTLRMD